MLNRTQGLPESELWTGSGQGFEGRKTEAHQAAGKGGMAPTGQRATGSGRAGSESQGGFVFLFFCSVPFPFCFSFSPPSHNKEQHVSRLDFGILTIPVWNILS